MCSARFYHFRMLQPTKGVHYFHSVLSFAVALVSSLQLSGAAGSSASNARGLHSFEILCYASFIVAWLVLGATFLLETCDRFEKQGSSLLRFGVVLTLAGMTIKLYYLIELKSNATARSLSSGISPSWEFFDILFLIQFTFVAMMSLIALCYLPGDAQFQQVEASLSATKDGQDPETADSAVVALTVMEKKAPSAAGETAENAESSKELSGGLKIESTGKDFPEPRASLCSRIFFTWMTPLMKLGFRRPLDMSDLWELGPKEKVATIAKDFQKHWDQEVQKAKTKSKSNETTTKHVPSLLRALVQTFGRQFFFGGTCLKIFNDASQFVAPVIMKELITFVRSQQTDSPAPLWHGYGLALAMYFFMLIGAACENQYFQNVMTVGMQIRGVLISKVFDHAMILSQRGRKGRSPGKMVNLVSNDTENLQRTCQNMNTVWSAPLRIIVAIVLLYMELSWAALVGFSLLLISVPLQREFVKRQGKLYRKTAGLTDKRLKHSNEAVMSMNVIKMYAWQDSMRERINEARNNELESLTSAKILGAWNTVMITAVPILVTIVSFSCYATSIGELTAEKAFTSMALFGVLRYPLIQLPSIITQLVSAGVSIGRISDFLSADTVSSDSLRSREVSGMELKDNEEVIHIAEKSSFAWDFDSEDADMHDIPMSVTRGELITVVGKTGSGKSSLLSVMLGELACISSKNDRSAAFIKGRVAYVPQESWVFNATLRNNILFGMPYNEKRYKKAIRVAQMESDLEQLADGDHTEIGEKGVNLSGGQRQRVAIARAVYADADVYLFDDPLSALDAKVARRIYDDCICGHLKGKTIILVTNRVEFVGGSDKVYLMDEGTVRASGTYSWMREHSSEFSHMMAGIADVSEEGDESQTKGNKEDEDMSTKESNDSQDVSKDPASSKADDEQASTKGALIKKEHRAKGSVSLAVVAAYGRAMGGISVLITVVLLYCTTEATKIGSTYWLKFWASDQFNLLEEVAPDMNATDLTTSSSSTTNTAYLATYVGGYAGFSMFAVILTLCSAYVQTFASLRAARSLHIGMINSLMRAPMSFFHSTPLGRILNRFSKDQNDIDKTMEFAVGLLIRGFVQLIGAFIVIGLATPYTLLAFVPVLFGFVYCQRYFQRTSRELKRMDSVTRSPVYAHFSECLNGLSSIRAYGRLPLMGSMNRIRLDNHLRMNLASFSANRWLGMRMEILGGLLIFASAVFIVVGSKQLDPESVGLQLTYAIQITGLLNLVVRISSLAENSFNSVERVIEYSTTPVERSDDSTPAKQEELTAAKWPSQGVITFKDVVARYRKDLEPVLNSLSFEIGKSEKVGIVGRTGAGKSSLFLTLFRIIERDSGSIMIDGQDIETLGLNDLRRALAIIPQEPVLFSGSVRFNLDPFGEFEDSQLWSALGRAHLKDYVKAHGIGKTGLDMEVGESGSNFSVGQRQLLCLARALLKNAKILVLDEATAAVDVETDELIQKTIREAFAGCTTLTIAHRLNTIIDSDRVLVLDRGKKLEYDTPANLLNPEKGYSAFSSMVDETGKENAAHLRAMARGEQTNIENRGGESKVQVPNYQTAPRRRSVSDAGSLLNALAGSQSDTNSDAGVMLITDNAVATLRDLVEAVGSGGASESKLLRSLSGSGVDELSWLQRLKDTLVQLNILIEEHIDDLMQQQGGALKEATDLATRLH